MKRLWVRFALVIGAVILILTVLPPLYGLVVELGIVPAPKSVQDFADVIDYLPEEARLQFTARMQRFARTYFSRALIGAAIVGILAGVWLSRMLAAPLRELERGTRAIANQELGHRVPVRGSQEMQTVARSFNRMAAQLEEAETLRRNLLADVAHELRHPLHVVQGNLQAILDGVYPLKEEEIARLVDQTQHLIRLVNDLHELAQAEAHQLPLCKQTTDVAALVKEEAASFNHLAAAKEVELRVELLGTQTPFPVDPARMRQVLHNLLNNALTHTTAGEQIWLKVEQRQGECEIRVVDTGRGIEPEQLPYVFDRFYQADSARSRDQAGIGLGLAIVKAIVEAHQGRVAISSPGKGQGSTFTIILPTVETAA